MDSIGNIINRINLILGALFDVAGIGGGGGGRRFGGTRSENGMGRRKSRFVETITAGGG